MGTTQVPVTKHASHQGNQWKEGAADYTIEIQKDQHLVNEMPLTAKRQTAMDHGVYEGHQGVAVNCKAWKENSLRCPLETETISR